jgi:hypothetical protein
MFHFLRILTQHIVSYWSPKDVPGALAGGPLSVNTRGPSNT